jgi:hypothetical protein
VALLSLSGMLFRLPWEALSVRSRTLRLSEAGSIASEAETSILSSSFKSSFDSTFPKAGAPTPKTKLSAMNINLNLENY